MTRQRRRIAPRVAVTCCVLLTLASASAADARLKNSVRVLRPGAGNVTVEVIGVRVTGPGHRKLRNSLRVRMPEARSLPSSVRVLTARRVVRTRRATRYGLVIVTIERAVPKARAAADEKATEPSLLFAGKGEKGRCLNEVETLCLFFGSPVAADFLHEDVLEGEREEDRRNDLKKQAHFLKTLNPPAAAAAQVSKQLTDLFGGVSLR